MGHAGHELACNFPIHEVSVSNLIPGSWDPREISSVASANLLVSCHHPGLLGWALFPCWGGCLSHLCWDCSLLYPLTGQVLPMYFNLAHFLSSLEEH